MKRKLFIAVLMAAALLLVAGLATAETDPIVCSMEVTPARLTGPGTVEVTISISNSGSEDMKDPVILYNPVSQVVSEFGTNGAVILKAGETKTWTGKWDVNQRTLENGSVVFFVKYTLYKDSGESYSQSQPIRGKIAYQAGDEAGIEIKRTISPSMAREDQVVTVKYDIINTGSVPITGIVVQESITKEPQKIDTIEAGKTAQVKFNVKMGKKDLVSKATITYVAGGTSSTETVDEQKITYGEPAMITKLTSSSKGVPINEKITLTLEIKNNGTVDYSDLRVTDPILGDVFTNQALKAGGELKLEKEITLTATTDYQFTITAIDNTGTEVSLTTDAVTVTAVDPNKALHLEVVATADRTEVFEKPGRVRFSIKVTNDSEIEAKKVGIYHSNTKIYTFESIPAGESRSLTRDAALSQAGKYQFTASVVDDLSNTLNFKSNEMQIAFSVPTPAPATPEPVGAPTPEPVFVPVTMPPITDPSIGAFPKMVHTILWPILIVSGVLLIGSAILLAIATKRRAEQKKASEAAYDHLERAKRRDYVTPAEPDEVAETPKASARAHGDEEDERVSREKVSARKKKAAPSQDHEAAYEMPTGAAAHEGLDEFELPHVKYWRGAYEDEKEAEGQAEAVRESRSLLDEDGYEDMDLYTKPNLDDVMFEATSEEPYDDAYGDGYGYAESSDYAAANTESGLYAAVNAQGEAYDEEYYDEAYDAESYEAEGYDAEGNADDGLGGYPQGDPADDGYSVGYGLGYEEEDAGSPRGGRAEKPGDTFDAGY